MRKKIINMFVLLGCACALWHPSVSCNEAIKFKMADIKLEEKVATPLDLPFSQEESKVNVKNSHVTYVVSGVSMVTAESVEKKSDPIGKFVFEISMTKMSDNLYQIKDSIGFSFPSNRWASSGTSTEAFVNLEFEIKESQLGQLKNFASDELISTTATGLYEKMIEQLGHFQEKTSQEFRASLEPETKKFTRIALMNLENLVLKMIKVYPKIESYAESDSAKKRQVPDTKAGTGNGK